MLSIELNWPKPADTLVVTLNGEAGMADADDLDHTLTAANATAAKLVVFDCSGLKFLASLSLGTLMHFQSQARRAGTRVCFAGVQPQVKTMLQRARLDQICDLCDNVEAASRMNHPRLSN